MSSLEIIDEVLKERLSIDRYEHSVRVGQMAEEYARIYNYDLYIASLVGYSHDIAKQMSYEDSIKYILDNDFDKSLLEIKNKYLMHGYIGADILEKEYGFTKEMGDAVRYHTTGRSNMTQLDKIIFLADKTEYGRNFPLIEEERILAKDNLDKAMLFVLKNTINSSISKGKRAYTLSFEALDYFRKICENDDNKTLKKCS